MPRSNHFLKRSPENEPVCACGFRPEILDHAAPVGVIWKAKRDVLNHVQAVLGLRPAEPFVTRHERTFPRAGVRPGPNGRWKLTLWDEVDVSHPVPEPWHESAKEAFEYGWLIIQQHRKAGTRLNGMGK